jgi:hypothetical protein
LTAHTGVYTSNETDDDDDEMEVDQWTSDNWNSHR